MGDADVKAPGTISLRRDGALSIAGLTEGAITSVAVIYASLYLALARIMALVVATAAHVAAAVGIHRAFVRTSTAVVAVVLAEIGVMLLGVGSARMPPAVGVTVFLALLALAVLGARSALHISASLRELRAPRSSFERWIARRLANPLDAVFVRLVLVVSAVIVPCFSALVVPASRSPYVMVLFIAMVTECAEKFELVDHTNMHNRVFSPNSHCNALTRAALRSLSLWHEYALTLFMGRIPHRYRIQHIYVHHVENNGPRDPQSTLPYDRTSYFAFCRFALKMGMNSTLPFDVSRYLIRARRYRLLVFLHVNILAYIALVVTLFLVNPPAAFLLLALRFSFGVGAALLNFYEHGLIDPAVPSDAYRNAATVALAADDHGTLGNDLHIAHHLHPGRHWSQLIEEARANAAVYHDRGAIVYRDTRGIVRKVLMRRFDELAASCDAGGLESSDVVRELQRRAEGPSFTTRRWRVRRLDEWLAEFAGKVLIPV
jgi:fatty acid desaturase